VNESSFGGGGKSVGKQSLRFATWQTSQTRAGPFGPGVFSVEHDDG
jgi:hypothetical protein